jgi:hypothetical protein
VLIPIALMRVVCLNIVAYHLTIKTPYLTQQC